MQHVWVNTRPLERVRAQIRAELRAGGPPGPVRMMFRQWGARYLGAERKRALENSRGGGEWPPLKPETIKRRRKPRTARIAKTTGKADRRFKRGAQGGVAILQDTGTLLAAMQRGSRGNLFKDIRRGIRVGFGPTKHPADKTATIAQIARWHHDGAGKLPARKLLHDPKGDPALVRGMTRDAKRALQRMFRRHELKGVR